MATFSRFEDIIAWQKARVLCKLIHGFTLKEPFYRDFKLVNSNDSKQVHSENPKLETQNSEPGTIIRLITNNKNNLRCQKFNS
jgi:hypothetical protein